MIFDTDVLIWFFRGDRYAANLIDSRTDREVSIVSWMELIQGSRSHNETRITRRFFRDSEFRVLPLDETISHLAANLMEEYALSDGLQVAEALVAATARQTVSVLATANVRHFRIPGLELKAFRPLGS